jgi:aminoglycoside phosphotransferase (APT) family kinase protein
MPTRVRPVDVAAAAGALGTTVVAVDPIGWGDARATYRLALTDGRTVAARWFDGTGPASDIARIAALMVRLGRAGLPVPDPTIAAAPGGSWLLTSWVGGETGAAWLDTPDRARKIADRMGRLARRLRAVDPTGLGLDSRGASPTARARDQLVSVSVPESTRERLEAAVDRLERGRPAATAFVHGDFVPINVIVDPDGEILSLLDLEHARIGPEHGDVAWWGWVIHHHHPDAWAAAWSTFRTSAGIDRRVPDEDFQALALVELIERASSAVDAEARRRWGERLAVAAFW